MAPNTTTRPTSFLESDSSLECSKVPFVEKKKEKAPKMGPGPTLLSRRQVDALYSLLEAVTNGLKQLEIPYILTGGSLLGAIRQHSILFCDDDIDLAILESDDGSMYERAKSHLPTLLGNEYQYSVKPWEGGDKVRMKSCSNVFLDVFVIRKYISVDELIEVIGMKKNMEKQSDEYVKDILNTINNSLHSQGEINMNGSIDNSRLELPCPIWHFNTRKAIELWPKEVYRECELFPTVHNLKMGPVVELSGPQTPVWLLKRAFGSDCFEVYYQSVSHGRKCAVEKNATTLPRDGRDSEETNKNNQPKNLPPLVASGGQWSQSVKARLLDEHYLPMQPVSKTKRRHTLHDKSNLFEYLESQSEHEVHYMRTFGLVQDIIHQCIDGNIPTSKDVVETNDGRTVYMDGVFDLFHVGHLHAIQQCAALGDRVIIGLTGDDDATGYKRRPIISEADRTAIIKSLKVVDDVVCPCPLIVTKEFMQEWGIDLVVHGFADPNDLERQKEFFQVAMDEGKFQEIEYYSQLSTTDIIERVRADNDGEKKQLPDHDISTVSKKNGINPKWFGAALSAATNKSYCIPYDPFPLELRQVIEQQLRKATKKRQHALDAIQEATGVLIYNQTLSKFVNTKYAEEGTFIFDKQRWKIHESFLQSCSLPTDFDLSQLHESENPNLKDEMLFAFARDRLHFQKVYDEFVRAVCCPFVASQSDEPINEVYYQAFPCVRVVRPGDFSIGPHADCAYGHHPCSINMYIPLTKIGDSASLFLESRPGSEDWRPIKGSYGMVKHFAGAMCAHWTPENNTDYTRVSLDFRIIPGPLFHKLKCGGKQAGGVRDVYREKEGYYSRSCFKDDCSKSSWIREGSVQTPDARFGFPWTKFKPTKK